MEKLKCPLCGTSCVTATDRAAWFEVRETVILYHPAPPGGPRHPMSNLCLASGCSVSLAEGIAA